VNLMAQDNRKAVRIPTREVEKILLEEGGSIDVQVEADKDLEEKRGALQDIHQNGMCFILANHPFREGDIIHLETQLGKFFFETDAIVRWAMGSHVGVEFLDPQARDAAYLAELYTTRLLNYLKETEAGEG